MFPDRVPDDPPRKPSVTRPGEDPGRQQFTGFVDITGPGGGLLVHTDCSPLSRSPSTVW
jgi:hypothetical protein